jgi:hypothetical protein
VVAGEVRSLAQRSAAAAKEIKALIADSVSKVESGARLVETAGATMDEVVGSIRRVTDIMAEITAASQEQSGGLEQINQAVSQMDRVTQQNAALVEEAAAAAESMQEQAQVLARAVAVFKLAPLEAAGEDDAAEAPEDAHDGERNGAAAPGALRDDAGDAADDRPADGTPPADDPFDGRTWPEVERRGPNRAQNVQRLPRGAQPDAGAERRQATG